MSNHNRPSARPEASGEGAASECPSGFFSPPGGCNPRPTTRSPFDNWGYLPHCLAAEDPMGERLPSSGRIIMRVIIDLPQPQFMQNGRGPFSVEIQDDGRREIIELGQENPWKPYVTCPDSREKYPMGSLFPRPKGGWSGSEEADFKQAVRDHWKYDSNPKVFPTSSTALSTIDALWKAREREKRDFWVKFAMVPDGVTVPNPELANETTVSRAIRLGTWQFDGWPRWEFREIYTPPSVDTPVPAHHSTPGDVPSGLV